MFEESHNDIDTFQRVETLSNLIRSCARYGLRATTFQVLALPALAVQHSNRKIHGTPTRPFLDRASTVG